MDILKRIEGYAVDCPNRKAFVFRNESVTYGELWEKSGNIAAWIKSLNIPTGMPIPIYGHKNILMPICMIACTRAGHAYVPIDTSMPEGRVKFILDTVGSQVAINTEEDSEFGKNIINTVKGEIEEIASDKLISYAKTTVLKDEDANGKGDVHYIIFTSGSTGKPKGVEVTTGNLESYLAWSEKLVYRKQGVFLNQAPFSFDLSVMDTYTGLATGSTIACIDKAMTEDVASAIDFVKANHVTYWISTPSFSEICLGSEKFNGDDIPSLRKFLFCGEPLRNQTAKALLERFPDADVINTYGPTETTVCVTSVIIDKKIVNEEAVLPVGVAKEGTTVYAIDEDGRRLPFNANGELVITGDTVAKGYFEDKVKTELSFFINEDGLKAYKTGDMGYVTENGMVYCIGRSDSQIKLHGYRIELGDIERNLADLEYVDDAVVLTEMKDGVPYSLTACIAQDAKVDTSYKRRKWLRESLGERLPKYMVPKKIVFFESFPLTSNGKIDKKKIREEV